MYFLSFLISSLLFLKYFSIFATERYIDYYGNPLNFSIEDNRLNPYIDDEILDLSMKGTPTNPSNETNQMDLPMASTPTNPSNEITPMDLSISGASANFLNETTQMNLLMTGIPMNLPMTGTQTNPSDETTQMNLPMTGTPTNPSVNNSIVLQPIIEDENSTQNVDYQNFQPHINDQQNSTQIVEKQTPLTNVENQQEQVPTENVDNQDSLQKNNSAINTKTYRLPLKFRMKEKYKKECEPAIEINEETLTNFKTSIDDIEAAEILLQLSSSSSPIPLKDENVSMLSETSNDSPKRPLETSGDNKGKENCHGLKRLCTTPNSNSTEKETIENTDSNHNDQKKDILILYTVGRVIEKKNTEYTNRREVIDKHSKTKKKNNPKSKRKHKEKEKYSETQIPKYTFKIDLKSIKKAAKDITKSPLQIDKNNDISFKNLVNCFTLIFCNVETNADITTFTPKTEFTFLELVIPEFLPFINFINKLDFSKEVNPLTPKTKKKIATFNTDLNSWLNKYHERINKEYIASNFEKRDIYCKCFHSKSENYFVDLRNLFADFLKILNCNEKLTNGYRVLIELYKIDKEKNSYSYILDVNFFIYFIACLGDESNEYLKKWNKHANILDPEKSNDIFIEQAQNNTKQVCNWIVLVSTLPEYKEMLIKLKMDEFNLNDHFDGVKNLKEQKHEGYFIIYKKISTTKKNRLSFNQLTTLLYYEFLKRIFDEKKEDSLNKRNVSDNFDSISGESEISCY